MGSASDQLTTSLAHAFNALADEVQSLTDRKTVLEHKLRFAHEQFQHLADKYAPANPEIAETLARLQLPPHTSVDETNAVPLLQRRPSPSQHEIALVIRDGRRIAAHVTSLATSSKTTASTRETLSRTSDIETSMSTMLEQDFTVEGKKSDLRCPFSNTAAAAAAGMPGEHAEETDASEAVPLHTADPICAALYENASQAGTASDHAATKCPIRFLDKHTPEEIAHYVETHKHNLPRSHEICVRRYQRNEEQIRKLDSKYGNLVNMIEDLSQLHQPMLPENEQQEASEVDKASNERVESWAQAVSTETDVEAPQGSPQPTDPVSPDRVSHFDRPLKEVRVGESPSRPWGISVPVFEPSHHDSPEPFSPPAAPVRMPSPERSQQTPVKKAGGKCPFDHTKLAAMGLSPAPKIDHKTPRVEGEGRAEAFTTPGKGDNMSQPAPQAYNAPTFINPETSKGAAPQMVFTGPVFIGYPMEQAIQFMNQYRGGS